MDSSRWLVAHKIAARPLLGNAISNRYFLSIHQGVIVSQVPNKPLHNLVVDNGIQPGQTKSLLLSISKSYSGSDVRIPAIVSRGLKDGPTLVVTAALHGDEINGTGVVRQLIIDRSFKLIAGTLILVPVVNILGFERHSRYMPDRRDLNRCFPGSRTGSLASRMAYEFFSQVMRNSDYAIDLHTAALRRTNFPNIRADISDPRLASFAKAFGAELIVNGRGPTGSLRNAACKAGCSTIILEAGEVWKVEPNVVEYALRGITNCLSFLQMIDAKPVAPKYRIVTDSTRWIRAKDGGFLQFHVRPGDIVAKGDAIVTNLTLSGDLRRTVRSPRAGIVLGMTTLPAVAPGSAICHLAFAKSGALAKAEEIAEGLSQGSLYERVKDETGSGIMRQDEARAKK